MSDAPAVIARDKLMVERLRFLGLPDDSPQIEFYQRSIAIVRATETCRNVGPAYLVGTTQKGRGER